MLSRPSLLDIMLVCSNATQFEQRRYCIQRASVNILGEDSVATISSSPMATLFLALQHIAHIQRSHHITSERIDKHIHALENSTFDEATELEQRMSELEQSIQMLPENADRASRVRLEYQLDVIKRRKLESERAALEAATPQVKKNVEPTLKEIELRTIETFTLLTAQLNRTSAHMRDAEEALEMQLNKTYIDRYWKAVKASQEKLDAANACLQEAQRLVGAAQIALENPYDSASPYWRGIK